MPTYEEWQESHVKAQMEAQEQARKDVEQASKDAETITGGPGGAETAEQQRERVAQVRRTMVFGDTDTTAGAGAVGTDVPSADNEGASVAAAEAASEDADVSHDEARRQVDVDAGTTLSAEEVTEDAPADNRRAEPVEVVADDTKPKTSSRKASDKR